VRAVGSAPRSVVSDNRRVTAAHALPTFTFDEYLRLDEVSEGRREWVAGQVHAMAGGTDRHLAVMQALFIRLAPMARRSGCRPWMADRRLRTSHASYYPDLLVVCGPRADPLFEASARLIIEVLSPSTTAIDLREKAAAYTGVPGITSYVVVDPDLRSVRVGTPSATADWSWVTYSAMGSLPLLDGQIDLTALWAEVDEVAPPQ
jgi:Uma2 family endonuclease